ncbi:MAG TPA: cyanophycin synthetase [Nocardioidaceae bacterium]|nr:cyanophycin synthetase [Nocardioidaceae bacterium]
MPDAPATPSYGDVERALLSRWPESRLDPTLDRIAAVCDLLGEPQRSYPVIHVAGTNGKTSTSRMVDALLRALGLRTGRFTSPHLESMTERISVDAEPLTEERFAQLYAEVLPYAEMVDRSGGHPLSFFELVTAIAFAAFADAPVDAAVLEVGMGGRWDATNVADAAVAVVTPVAVDHTRYLGHTPGEIAVEKAGVIKPGAFAVLAEQPDDAAEALLRRVVEVGATVAREGVDFGVVERAVAVGGQRLTLQGLGASYDEVFLPLHGAHQAQNAACALAAVEAFTGGAETGALGVEVVREAFAAVTSPGRLEVVRRSPPVILDAAHNPHGAAATAAAVEEVFALDPLVGVVSSMADKDVSGVLDALEPVLDLVVCSQNSTRRAMPTSVLAAVAREVFGAERVIERPRLDDALEAAIELAETSGTASGAAVAGGVLVTGSVITAGEARTLLGGPGSAATTAAGGPGAAKARSGVGAQSSDGSVDGR